MQTFVSTILLKNAILKESYDLNKIMYLCSQLS